MLQYQTILVTFWALQLLCAMSLKCWFRAWWWLQAILFAVWILFCLKVIVFLCYLCVLLSPRSELHVRLFWLCPMCTLIFLHFDKWGRLCCYPNLLILGFVLKSNCQSPVNCCFHSWSSLKLVTYHLVLKLSCDLSSPAFGTIIFVHFQSFFPMFVLGFGWLWLWLWHTGCSRVDGFDEREHSGQILLRSVFILQSSVFDGERLKTYSHLFRACG